MITAIYARKIFSYEKATGELRWMVSLGRRAQVGTIAGSINGQGYREVMVGGKTYQASRLIWLIVKGCWPKGEVDHRNLKRSDNRWKNLRDATLSQNRSNCRARSNNSTGFKGVGLPDKKNGKYYPYIQVENRRIRLGGFHTATAAHAAWVAAAKKYRGEFARAA
jgi:HNH endonuclease